jgi:hypothetical protein
MILINKITICDLPLPNFVDNGGEIERPISASRNSLISWRAMARLPESIVKTAHSSCNGRRGRIYSLFAPCSDDSIDKQRRQNREVVRLQALQNIGERLLHGR